MLEHETFLPVMSPHSSSLFLSRTASCSLPPSDCPFSSFPYFSSVGEWLEAIEMSRYKDSFVAAGYCYLDSVARMTVQ